MISALVTHLGLGLLLGCRHAFEADHIAAVATIVSRERNPLRSSVIGAFWGMGHLTSLLLVGIPVILLGLHFPVRLDAPLELGIGAMIVFLGIGGLKRSARGHSHSHGPLGTRPFWVGAAHGFAGSGALTLVILGTMPSRPDGMLYLGAFGLGSVAGMAAASATLSIPLAMPGFGAKTTTRLARAVSLASIAFGIFYGFKALAATIAGRPLS